MKSGIYSVRDIAVEAFGRPFEAPSDAAATRSFTDECLREGSPLAAHPEDYALYRLGTFHNHNGDLIGCDPKKLLTGLDVKSSQKIGENDA